MGSGSKIYKMKSPFNCKGYFCVGRVVRNMELNHEIQEPQDLS